MWWVASLSELIVANTHGYGGKMLDNFTESELHDLEYCINHQIGMCELALKKPLNAKSEEITIKYKDRYESLREKVRKM